MEKIDTTELISALLDRATKPECPEEMITKLKEVAAYLIESL